MKRRDFLKLSGSLSATPLLLNGFMLEAFASPGMLEAMSCNADERVLVIVQLKGGNDGINTLVPINQYDTYANLRPNIKLPNSGTHRYIDLDTTLPLADQVGLNPNLVPFKEFYDQGKLHIIQGVAYPNQNKSHFKSTDLWLSAGDGRPENFNISTGWMGRYLESRFPTFQGVPTADLPDPLGIQLGDRKPSLGFHTESQHAVEINLAGQDPAGFYTLVAGIGGLPPTTLPASEYGEELEFILSVENNISAYAERVTEVFNNGSNSSVTYPDDRLSRQLRTVARLLAGGSKTKVFLVNQSGYDTHVDQTENNGESHIGRHARLLDELSQALKAFHQDIAQMGLDNRVVSITFSEFGRKAEENGNVGTDHGTLAPMFVLGSCVQGGITGTNIDLSNLDRSGAPHIDQIQHDYRQVFGSLLKEWMAADDNSLQSAMLLPYASNQINLILPNHIPGPDCTITTPPPTTDFSTKAKLALFLEGYYDEATQIMRTDLRSQNLLPTTQPFSVEPFKYEGTETIEHSEADVVDWVLLEVRDRYDRSLVLTRKAALLASNGLVRDTDFSDVLTFPGLRDGEYYVCVYHKSHLAVMSNHRVTFVQEAPPQYSFYTSRGQAEGRNQLKRVGDIYALHAGDFDHNGVINNQDFNQWKQNGAAVDQYMDIDADGNGVVNNQDYNQWKGNKSKIGISDIQR